MSQPRNPLSRCPWARRVFSGWWQEMKRQGVHKSTRTYGYDFPKPSQLYGGNRFLIPTVVRPLRLCLWNADLPSGWNWGLDVRMRESKQKTSESWQILLPAGLTKTDVFWRWRHSGAPGRPLWTSLLGVTWLTCLYINTDTFSFAQESRSKWRP